MKKSKRIPSNQSPTEVNFRDQSPIEVNFKRARHDCSDHSDDSDMEDGTGYEDFPITNLDTFTKQGTLNQQDVPIEKMEAPLREATLAIVEHHEVVVILSFLCMALSMSWLKPRLFKASLCP